MKGNVGSAAELAQAILARHPNNPDALHLMGTVALMAAQIDAALDLLTRAAAGKPADPAIRCNLANALLRKGDPATAEFHLRKALKVDPGQPGRALLPRRVQSGGRRHGRRQGGSTKTSRPPAGPSAGAGRLRRPLRDARDFATARHALPEGACLGTVSALALGGLATFEKFCEGFRRRRPRSGASPAAGTEARSSTSTSATPPASIAENAGDYDEAFAHFADAKRFARRALRHRRASEDAIATLKSVFDESLLRRRGKAMATRALARSSSSECRGPERRSPNRSSRQASRCGGGGRAWGHHSDRRFARAFAPTMRAAFAKRLAKLDAEGSEGACPRYLAVLDRVSADCSARHRQDAAEFPASWV